MNKLLPEMVGAPPTVSFKRDLDSYLATIYLPFSVSLEGLPFTSYLKCLSTTCLFYFQTIISSLLKYFCKNIQQKWQTSFALFGTLQYDVSDRPLKRIDATKHLNQEAGK